MPQFCNPSSEDEDSSIPEEQKSTPSWGEQKINIVNFRDETVGYRTKKIEPRRSLSMNNYGYEQHLRTNEYEFSELKIPVTSKTVDDTSNHKPRHLCKQQWV